MSLPADCSNGMLTVTLRLRSSTNWAEAGHEIAWMQAALGTLDKQSIATVTSHTESKLDVQTAGSTVTISGVDWSMKFDRARGHLTSWVSGPGSVALLTADPANGAAILPTFWRAPTDNDVPSSLIYWRRFGVDDLTSQLRSFNVKESADATVVETTTFLSPPVLDWGWVVKTQYKVMNTGILDINVDLKPTGYFPEHVPRVGLDLRLNKDMSQVQWSGLGPGESYPDKKSAQKAGVWSVDDLSELHTPYEVPQENGNRMETSWVTVTEGQGHGLRATASMKEGFSWRAGRHTDKVLETAKHPCDLIEEDASLLRLDAKVAGVGTGACGPQVREDLMVKTEEMSFAFTLARTGFSVEHGFDH